MAVPLLENGGSLIAVLQKLGMVAVLIVIIFLGATLIHKKLLNYLARNQEALFLFGIAWALILAAAFDLLGFSLEIGALIAGMSLASSKYTLELGGKMKPLRDFFVVLFFVFFGSQLAGRITPFLVKSAIIFSLLIIVGKPLIIMSILRIFGYTKRTNFLASSSLAQISEFSLILILLGFNLGHISQEIMSLAVLVALITIGISSYNIYYSQAIFHRVANVLDIFESKKIRDEARKREKNYDVILFGYHRIGYKILERLEKMKARVAVIDYNPRVIIALGKDKVESIYGDAGDRDFLSEIGIDKAKMIISTVPDPEANIAIKEMMKELGSKATFIATAEQPRAALDLYELGVDYVIIPHHLGGEYASSLVERFGTSKASYAALGKKHHHDLKKGKDKSSFS